MSSAVEDSFEIECEKIEEVFFNDFSKGSRDNDRSTLDYDVLLSYDDWDEFEIEYHEVPDLTVPATAPLQQIEVNSQSGSLLSTYSIVAERNIPPSSCVAEETKNDQAVSSFSFPQTEEDVPLESSRQDFEDASQIFDMFAKDSKACCPLKCNKIIPQNVAVQDRHRFLELDKNEQDLVILAFMQTSRRLHDLDSIYAERNTKKKFRSNQDGAFKLNTTNYTFRSLDVCKKFFFFIHPIGIKRFKNLINHYSSYGLSSRMHKNAGKTSSRENVLSVQDIETVVQFIKNYAEKYGLPLPGRIPGCKDFAKALKLSSADTKSVLYRKYCEAIDATPEKRKLSATSFNDVWRKYLPHISPLKPASDRCDICRQNVQRIQRSSNSDDEEKSAALAEAVDHLEKAKLQRDHYNMWRDKAKKHAETDFNGITGIAPLDVADTVEAIVPEKMSAQRQWYLYNEIRSLCHDEKKKDLVAPKPKVQYESYARKKKGEKKENLEEKHGEVEPTAQKRKRGRPVAGDSRVTKKAASNK